MSWCALLSVGPSSCSRVHSRASAMPLSPMTMIEMPTAASMYVENRSTLSAPLTAKASAPTSAWWTEAEESATLVAMTARPVARSLPLREMSRQARPEEAQGPSSGPAEGGHFEHASSPHRSRGPTPSRALCRRTSTCRRDGRVRGESASASASASEGQGARQREPSLEC